MPKDSNVRYKIKLIVAKSAPGQPTENIETLVEDFINQDNINPIEVNHTYTAAPYPITSVLISYTEVSEKLSTAIKEGVDAADKEMKKNKSSKKKK